MAGRTAVCEGWHNGWEYIPCDPHFRYLNGPAEKNIFLYKTVFQKKTKKDCFEQNGGEYAGPDGKD